jgi:ribosome biogenesis SPOUT family RNA methylase Rps3
VGVVVLDGVLERELVLVDEAVRVDVLVVEGVGVEVIVEVSVEVLVEVAVEVAVEVEIEVAVDVADGQGGITLG